MWRPLTYQSLRYCVRRKMPRRRGHCRLAACTLSEIAGSIAAKSGMAPASCQCLKSHSMPDKVRKCGAAMGPPPAPAPLERSAALSSCRLLACAAALRDSTVVEKPSWK